MFLTRDDLVCVVLLQTGACSDGSGRCEGWLKSHCGRGGNGTCILDMQDYGVKFGPDNSTGSCIASPASSATKGRFPGESTALYPLPLISSYKSEKSLCGAGLHGKNADGGLGSVALVERLWRAWAKNSTGGVH